MAVNNRKEVMVKKERETERERERKSDPPSPVTGSTDSFLAGSLSRRLWLPECIRSPVCNLTSQYWNSNASSHSINCCLVIGFQTCGTGNRDVLASSIMLCHGGRSGSRNNVKMKEEIKWRKRKKKKWKKSFTLWQTFFILFFNFFLFLQLF